MRYPVYNNETQPPVIGHTRPDIREVVELLMQREPERNEALARVLRDRLDNDPGQREAVSH